MAGLAARGRPRRMGLLLTVAIGVLAADIITKAVVVATLSDRPPVRLLGGLLTLRVDRNPGAAFSIGTSMTVVFTAIAAGVIVFILRTSRRIHSVAWAVTLGLLLGGATGNLVDRLLRAPGPLRGYVVDWIQLPHWPVFNVADSCDRLRRDPGRPAVRPGPAHRRCQGGQPVPGSAPTTGEQAGPPGPAARG